MGPQSPCTVPGWGGHPARHALAHWRAGRPPHPWRDSRDSIHAVRYDIGDAVETGSDRSAGCCAGRDPAQQDRCGASGDRVSYVDRRAEHAAVSIAGRSTRNGTRCRWRARWRGGCRMGSLMRQHTSRGGERHSARGGCWWIPTLTWTKSATWWSPSRRRRYANELIAALCGDAGAGGHAEGIGGAAAGGGDSAARYADVS